jgi:hypothetical protein
MGFDIPDMTHSPVLDVIKSNFSIPMLADDKAYTAPVLTDIDPINIPSEIPDARLSVSSHISISRSSRISHKSENYIPDISSTPADEIYASPSFNKGHGKQTTTTKHRTNWTVDDNGFFTDSEEASEPVHLTPRQKMDVHNRETEWLELLSNWDTAVKRKKNMVHSSN